MAKWCVQFNREVPLSTGQTATEMELLADECHTRDGALLFTDPKGGQMGFSLSSVAYWYDVDSE